MLETHALTFTGEGAFQLLANTIPTTLKLHYNTRAHFHPRVRSYSCTLNYSTIITPASSKHTHATSELHQPATRRPAPQPTNATQTQPRGQDSQPQPVEPELNPPSEGHKPQPRTARQTPNGHSPLHTTSTTPEPNYNIGLLNLEPN